MQGTRKILVSNLPPSIHEDYLELFFENTKQYGGGPVVNVTINKEKLTAIVEFETPDAVEKVLAKGNIHIMNQLVQVQKYNREELLIIEVKGPPFIVCEDNIEFLQLYFEHEKSKGGKVQTINFDRGRNSALITFESTEVAERVLQHNHILKQQSIQVQKFDPLPMISIEKRIRVKGVKDFGSEDALRFYFENKRRSGGGSIADIQFFHETNEAVITFENIADATSVLEKEHRFNNKTIEVSKYITAELRPFYPDRLLIHGVKSSSSDESLANLIEAKLGTRVRQFAYHKDRDDIVLVYLQTSFDLKNTQCKIKGWSLDEAELEVFQVQVTDCILVENIPELISEDTVGLYFDNARRSGGGNVKKTVMSADNRTCTCVVYFNEYSAVENVVAKEHCIYGKKIRVDRYLECLCLSEASAMDTSAPSSIVLSVNNYQIQNFISESEVFQQKLKKELKHLCAGLERNKSENQTLVVFIPRKGVVSNKFQRHWKEKVLRTIAIEEAGIQVHQKHVSDTDTQNILKRLSGKERNSDNVCISFDQTKGILGIVGFTGYIDLTIRFIDAVTDVKLKSMNINEENVSDSLTINNRLEMDMLQKLGVPDELKEKYPKLKVFFNKTEDKISFDGSQNDIRDAKLHLLETKLSLTSVDCRLSESAMKLFSTEETKEFIGGKLKKANTFCEWRVQNQRLSVCCSDNSDANTIVDIILLSVKERSLSLKPEAVSISVSEMWSNIETELQERYPGRFVMHIYDKTRVQLYATEDISSDIYADLQKLVEMEETRYIDELQHASEELMSLSDKSSAEGKQRSGNFVRLLESEVPQGRGSPRQSKQRPQQDKTSHSKEYQQLQRKKQAAAKVEKEKPPGATKHYFLFKENLSNFVEATSETVDPEKIINNKIKKTIDDYKELVKTLTTEEEKELGMVKCFANIKIDKIAGVISIDGPIREVGEAKSKLQTRLLNIERRRNEQKIAEENYKLFRWYFEEITNTGFEYIEYEMVLNLRIEQAYKANLNEVEFWDDKGNCYVIDLVNLVEYPKMDRQDTVKVLRKDILKQVTAALPQEWAPMKTTENFRRVNVPNTEQRYKDIEKRFLTEVKGGQYAGRIQFDVNKLQVSKIERIQNKTLYQNYMYKKKLMTEQKPNLPAHMPIERELWYGTTADAVDSIEMHGFNRSNCGKYGSWFGAGVYFAKCASYSARGYLYFAKPGATGVKGYIFLTKVLTGEFCKGTNTMRYLPPVDPNKPLVLYDCAVDNVAYPMEFVIFHDTQAYPEYIITFVA